MANNAVGSAIHCATITNPYFKREQGASKRYRSAIYAEVPRIELGTQGALAVNFAR